MRFIVDNALLPVLSTVLTQAGHDALHVRNIALQRAVHPRVMQTHEKLRDFQQAN